MRTNTYKQLAQHEREKIYQLKKKGATNSDIAEKLGRNKSTIGRELRRNQHLKLKQYLPDTAERKAEKRKAQGRKVQYVIKQPGLRRKSSGFSRRAGLPISWQDVSRENINRISTRKVSTSSSTAWKVGNRTCVSICVVLTVFDERKTDGNIGKTSASLIVLILKNGLKQWKNGYNSVIGRVITWYTTGIGGHSLPP